jgi:hypothetical protein
MIHCQQNLLKLPQRATMTICTVQTACVNTTSETRFPSFKVFLLLPKYFEADVPIKDVSHHLDIFQKIKHFRWNKCVFLIDQISKNREKKVTE